MAVAALFMVVLALTGMVFGALVGDHMDRRGLR